MLDISTMISNVEIFGMRKINIRSSTREVEKQEVEGRTALRFVSWFILPASRGKKVRTGKEWGIWRMEFWDWELRKEEKRRRLVGVEIEEKELGWK
jgi:hypothetical protein